MSVFTAEECDAFERSIATVVARRATDRETSTVDTAQRRAQDWSALAQLGCFAIPFEEAQGGLGGGLSDLLPVFDAIGRGLLEGPFAASLVVAPILFRSGLASRSQNSVAQDIAVGSCRLAYSDARPGTNSCAAQHGSEGDWQLSGQVCNVSDGEAADLLVVKALIGPSKEVGLFCLRGRHPSIHRQDFAMIDDRRASSFEFAESPVESDDVLLGPAAAEAIEEAEARAAIATAAETVGAMAVLNAMTLDHARIRRQFGVPVGSFQVLQHRLVDMMIAQKRGSAFVRAAAAAADQSIPGWVELALKCKAAVGTDARFVGEAAIQIHGGIGMTDECMVGHYFKRMLANDAHYGTAQQCRENLTARAIAKDEAIVRCAAERASANG